MKCLNCSSLAVNGWFCGPCQILYDLGMIPKDIILNAAPLAHISDSADPSAPSVVSVVSDDVIIPKEKKDISKLFLSKEFPILAAPSAGPNIPLPIEMMPNETLLDHIVDSQQDDLLHRINIERTLYQDVVEINRPTAILEIRNEDSLLTMSEIANIELSRNKSIDQTLKMIDMQCDNEQVSSEERYDRKQHFLSSRIEHNKREIARIRTEQLVNSGRRTKLRAEEIEKLTPEQVEDFKRRAARNSSLDPKKVVSQAEKDARKDVKAFDKAAIALATNLVKKGKFKSIDEALEAVRSM